MKLALVVDHYSEQTGYTENCLPRYLAKHGVEVHIVAPNVKPYFNSPWYAETYQRFYGPPIVKPGITSINGIIVHRLPHRMRYGYVESEGLLSTIKVLKPDVVQCLASMSWNLIKLTSGRKSLGYRLFTGNHMALSVFRPMRSRMSPLSKAWFFASRRMIGSHIARATEKCFSASDEGALICVQYYGIPRRKVVVLPLGVDTDMFHPVQTKQDSLERENYRESIGCREEEILCIYTGRFTEAKNPSVLADAIRILRADGLPFKGLFVGAGTQAEYIESNEGCSIKPFLPWSELCYLYRAGDIAVWPQEESMSALDAAASGIPVVLSDRIKVVERIEGNGCTYPHGSAEGLASALRDLQANTVRKALGEVGVKKMRSRFSWDEHAQVRMRHYRHSLEGSSFIVG